MNFKKITSLVLTCAMAISLVACGGGASGGSSSGSTSSSGSAASSSSGGSSGGSNTIRLWATGSENVRDIYEKLIDDFQSKSDYKVELNFLLSGTGAQTLPDMVAAAKKAGQTNTDYDLVDWSGDDLSKIVSQIGEDSFVKLDESKMPNYAGVSARSSVAGEYAMPYRGTTVILAYDSEKVPNPPKTMDELVDWMKANPGRFAYNTPGTGGAGDSFVRSCVYNQISDESAFTSDDEKWVAEWDPGFAFLADIHQYMYKSGGSIVYPNKNQGALDLLNNGEVDMVPMWADMVLSQRAKGEIKDTIQITQIQPALTGSLQTLTIPTIGSNEEGAYEFMNYMVSPEAQELMVKEMAAIPLIDASSMDMSGFEDIANLDTSKFRIQSIGSLSTQFNERWENEIATIG